MQSINISNVISVVKHNRQREKSIHCRPLQPFLYIFPFDVHRLFVAFSKHIADIFSTSNKKKKIHCTCAFIHWHGIHGGTRHGLRCMQPTGSPCVGCMLAQKDNIEAVKVIASIFQDDGKIMELEYSTFFFFFLVKYHIRGIIRKKKITQKYSDWNNTQYGNFHRQNRLMFTVL